MQKLHYMLEMMEVQTPQQLLFSNGNKNQILFYTKKNLGPAGSFWRLFTLNEIRADYYAFCDQDDIWDSNKLQAGVEVLKDQEEAALWCSNCRIIDQNGSIVDEK